MQLFYAPNIEEHQTVAELPEDEARHIIKVLRKSVGDTLYLTNGKGILFVGSIDFISKKQVGLKIESSETMPKPDYEAHLAIAPTKNANRIEWMTEKVVEIGVNSISFLHAHNSERSHFKLDRIERLATSALKQSHKFYLPKINALSSFEEFVKNSGDFDLKLIATCFGEARKGLHEVLKAKISVLILIGPEGDFSPAEVELAQKYGFQPVSFGVQRMRTETAALYACAAVAFVNQS